MADDTGSDKSEITKRFAAVAARNCLNHTPHPMTILIVADDGETIGLCMVGPLSGSERLLGLMPKIQSALGLAPDEPLNVSTINLQTGVETPGAPS